MYTYIIANELQALLTDHRHLCYYLSIHMYLHLDTIILNLFTCIRSTFPCTIWSICLDSKDACSSIGAVGAPAEVLANSGSIGEDVKNCTAKPQTFSTIDPE